MRCAGILAAESHSGTPFPPKIHNMFDIIELTGSLKARIKPALSPIIHEKSVLIGLTS